MAENTQLQYLWKQISERAEHLIVPISYDTFIKPLEPIDFSNRKIVLKAGSEMAANVIMNKHADKLREAISKCDLGVSDFRIYVEDCPDYPLEDDTDIFGALPTVSPLNKNFTFDSFVTGSGNKFVYAAAKAVAENPGDDTFNPLFIYGESGLGKTHLLHAIANELMVKSPEKKVLYTTCENFLNEFIDSIAQKSGARFRQHYRSVDILMIDDVQFLKNKTQVQEEFFHTFNELKAQNKQIVLTSDRPPKEIPTLEERLRTRFEGGMIADIQPPTTETKIAILKRKAIDRKCAVPDDVLNFLAKDSGHDVRTLEGRLTKVIFASKLHEEPITLELAKLALSESVSEREEQEDLTPEKIISAVCSYFKQKKEDLLGKSRQADFAKARQICAYLMCEMLSLPLVAVGERLGGRDHTTIMYARDKMEKLQKLNDKIAKEIDDIKNIVLKK